MKRYNILAEIIFSIIAVAVVGVFAVRMYVKAENMQNMARDLDMASFAAQSAVEAFKSGYLHPGTAYFDRDFRAVKEIDKKGFVLTMDINADGMGLFDLKVDVMKVAPYWGEVETGVFSLATSVYKGNAE